MNRRSFIGSGLIGGEAILLNHALSADDKVVAIDDVIFRWNVTENTVQFQLSAPTEGWLAAGFNHKAGLADTWFAIACVSCPIIIIEEHVAQPPDHYTVQSMGLQASIVAHSGDYLALRSLLDVTVSRKKFARAFFPLHRGKPVYLMLAWSRESDFEHHSAWRKQIAIIL